MEVEAEKESAPPTAKHPPPSSTQVSGAAFFAWTQDLRAIEFGFVREKPPRGGLNAWFNRAMLEVGGDLERLKAGFVAFSGDQYWRPRKAPWAGWIDQWERFVPSRASEPSPSAQAACAVHGCSKSANGVVWGKRLCASHHAAWTETEIRSEAEMASWVRAQTSPGAGLPPPQFNEQQYPRGEVAA